jgi:hypothetical protein
MHILFLLFICIFSISYDCGGFPWRKFFFFFDLAGRYLAFEAICVSVMGEGVGERGRTSGNGESIHYYFRLGRLRYPGVKFLFLIE